MSWFDIIKQIEMDEFELEGQELAEENCCAAIWKSIAYETPKVHTELEKTPLWTMRQSSEGCNMMVEWLRNGAIRPSYPQDKFWNTDGKAMNQNDYDRFIYNKKKGWLQDYVDCYNMKRPNYEDITIDMYEY
tara:strand:- start:156 stop:551 length:396 start_codon:yes stop_codon:yes gene_type:complete